MTAMRSFMLSISSPVFRVQNVPVFWAFGQASCRTRDLLEKLNDPSRHFERKKEIFLENTVTAPLTRLGISGRTRAGTASYACRTDALPIFCGSATATSNLPGACVPRRVGPRPNHAEGRAASLRWGRRNRTWGAPSFRQAHGDRGPGAAATCPFHPESL